MSFYLGDYNVGKFFIMIFLSIFMFGSFFLHFSYFIYEYIYFIIVFLQFLDVMSVLPHLFHYFSLYIFKNISLIFEIVR